MSIQSTQKIFNRWIRERDKDLPCISCGKARVEQGGHYLSAGHHSVHRFNEKNVHGQCLRCNYYLSGNLVNYRANLIKKIGLQQVEILEGTARKVKKWSKIELQIISKQYKI